MNRTEQAGDGQAGDGQAGDGQAGDGQAGAGQAGDGQAGDGQAGDGQAGSGQAGSGQAGNGQAGDGQAGNGQAGGVPEIVIAPARRDVRPGHDGDVVFEVREISDGGRALPVFTTVGRLVATLGPDQPWIALPLRNVQAIMGSAGVDRVLIDPLAQPGAWKWQASDLSALTGRL
ncbi:MAG TPA: SAV_915 family protein [Streptosporangiaceae bacterium]|nr:SAV_915 family protein [Streptosporangiaceae bacterium]